MNRYIRHHRIRALVLAIGGAVLGGPAAAFAQDSPLPGFHVIRGADDPAAIPMVKAYESMVRGHLIGDESRGTRFLSRQVRLSREGAAALFAYARDGWRRLVALQLGEADAICADREAIRTRPGLAERILAARAREDAMRAEIFAGALELLDAEDRERLDRFLSESRSQITTSDYDIERAITESPDTVRNMLIRVCAHVRD